ncbi:hypothetical protein F511_34741 [Dorcoceras hygrometricum]|uniref:Uncharacterized protein n=1 Tax=Dorcoceras hygrometricum TaxID=472368 RepID=A0A2Z7CJX5_9LAMI|nr:hypothetical protein F511_34741 [Dorcoceras hygrometricum]
MFECFNYAAPLRIVDSSLLSGIKRTVLERRTQRHQPCSKWQRKQTSSRNSCSDEHQRYSRIQLSSEFSTTPDLTSATLCQFAITKRRRTGVQLSSNLMLAKQRRIYHTQPASNLLRSWIVTPVARERPILHLIERNRCNNMLGLISFPIPSKFNARREIFPTQIPNSSSLLTPNSQFLILNTRKRFLIYANNGNKKREDSSGVPTEKWSNEDDEKMKNELPRFNLRWVDLLLDPQPDNIVAVGLTGLLTWASVQVLWQLFLVSAAILIAALKYTLVAALLVFILITLL